MKNLITICVLSAVLLLGVSMVAQAGVVEFSSFETGDDGWTFGADTLSLSGGAYDGVWYVHDPYDALITSRVMYKNITGLTIGATYKVSFYSRGSFYYDLWAGPVWVGPIIVQPIIDTPTTTWTYRSYTFTATNSTLGVRFIQWWNSYNGTDIDAFTLYKYVPPVANAGPDVVSEALDLSVESVLLDGSGSYDPDGTITYEWKDDSNNVISTTATVEVFLEDVGFGHSRIYTLKVTDNDNLTATDQVRVSHSTENLLKYLLDALPRGLLKQDTAR